MRLVTRGRQARRAAVLALTVASLVAILVSVPQADARRPSPGAVARAPYLAPPDIGVPGRYEISLSPVLRGRRRIEVHVSDAAGGDQHTLELQVARGSMLRRTPPPFRTVAAGRPAAPTNSWVAWPFRVLPGRVLCARARTSDGISVSAWSDRICVVRPLDDRQAVRSGPRSIRRSRLFADGKVTQLGLWGRLKLGHVPPGASFGPVFVHDRRRDGNTPTSYMAGRDPDRWPQEMVRWETEGRLELVTVKTHHGGTGVVEGRGSDFPVGGIVVVPRWINKR